MSDHHVEAKIAALEGRVTSLEAVALYKPVSRGIHAPTVALAVLGGALVSALLCWYLIPPVKEIIRERASINELDDVLTAKLELPLPTVPTNLTPYTPSQEIAAPSIMAPEPVEAVAPAMVAPTAMPMTPTVTPTTNSVVPVKHHRKHHHRRHLCPCACHMRIN